MKRIIKDAGLDCLDVTQKKHLKFVISDGDVEFSVVASVSPFARETSLKCFKKEMLRLYGEAKDC